MKTRIVSACRAWAGLVLLAGFTGTSVAAVPGMSSTTGTAGTFNLVAGEGYSSQPDGAQVYSWGYGCPAGSAPGFRPFTTGAVCPGMQIPGPTLIVYEGQPVAVTLTNNLPNGAGNTSMVFTGQNVTATAVAGTGLGGTTCPTNVQAAGLLATEAAPGCSVTYTFAPRKPGTYAYYSGSQPDLQIELGLYGALIVLPTYGGTPSVPGNPPVTCAGMGLDLAQPGPDFRLAPSAYDHAATCYDREYLFQFAEMDPRIHRQVAAQLHALKICTSPTTPPTPPAATNPTNAPCPKKLQNIVTEPYRPVYYLINGRSMPDDMDADYAPNYPAQPYNGNPHMHPLDLVLLRVIGQGRWEHPFHEHGNHVRVLARDGNLMTSQTDATKLAGLMMFTTDTFPGQSFDGIFYWSGKGLNWDIYGHTPPTTKGVVAAATESGTTVTLTTLLALSGTLAVGDLVTVSGLPTGYNGTFPLTAFDATSCVPTPPATTCTALNTVLTYTAAAAGLPAYSLNANPTATSAVSVLLATTDPTPCYPDANGYYTVSSVPPALPTVANYGEWCADHNHPLEANPVGQVGAGGPATLPDPLVATNGLWYNGTPYLGFDAVKRSRGPTPLPPGGALQNPPQESGIAFMWHSHNEREITTDDVFPGGMLMMMLVDPPTWPIDETL